MPEDTSTTPVTKSVKPADVAKKAPSEWAHVKGLVAPERPIHMAPWEHRAACVMSKWPDEALDPTFAVTEAEYDAAIAAVLAITLG